jgi:Ni/Co efflux regulator RcnB
MKKSLSLLASAMLLVSFGSFAADTTAMDTKAAAKPAAEAKDSKDDKDAKKDKKDKDEKAVHAPAASK